MKDHTHGWIIFFCIYLFLWLVHIENVHIKSIEQRLIALEQSCQSIKEP